MRAVHVHRFGPPDVLVLDEVPEPQVDQGQVLIDVEVAGVNFIETRVRAGAFADPRGAQFPYVPGNEVGGTVMRVGAGVEPTLVGRRVVTSTGGKGGYTERVVVAASNVIEIPDTLTTEVAVALFAHGRTAIGLMRETNPRPGERVLVEAAGGGVGSLLVQLAKEAGATVIAAAGGEDKLELAKSLGADLTVDYRQPGWSQTVRDTLPTDGVDVVFDSVGGIIGREALELLAGGGRFAMFGMASGTPTEGSIADTLRRGITVIGFAGARLVRQPHYARELEEAALRKAAAGKLKPIIGQRFPLEQAAQAHAAVEARATIGKTLLMP
jgi:NADPH2:quinone reductase